MPPQAEALASQHEALRTVEHVHAILAERFDLAAYNASLAELLDGGGQRIAPTDMSQFERPLHFDGLPEGFDPHFYRRHAGDAQAGIRPTRTELLGKLNDRQVFDKREDTHEYVRAFKARGALFTMLDTLSRQPDVRVFTANSTGNHARGVVAAVNMLNQALIESGAVRVNEYGEVLQEDAGQLFRARIYTSSGLEPEKRQALMDGGAEVLDTFATLGQAGEAAQKDAKDNQQHTAYVHPYDTDMVIAGQATLGMELLFDLAQQGIDLRNTPVTLRVAVGGGGMFAGQVVAFQHAIAVGLLHPASRVVAVEAEGNDSTRRELLGLPPLTARTLNTVAGGIATLQSGRRGVAAVRAFSPGGVRLVDNAYMLRAAEMLARAHDGVPPEFAGTLSLASLLKDTDEGLADTGPGVDVTVTCGGNASPALLHNLLEKTQTHEDTRVQAAGEYLGPAVFRLISHDALEPPPVLAVVAAEPTRHRVRAPLQVVSRPFAAAA